MELDSIKFVQLIRNKLAVAYIETGKTISLDFASGKIGISKATLSRVLNGHKFDIVTFLRICTWLEKEVGEFIKK